MSRLYPVKKFMEIAIDEAVKARNQGDYAVGAVIVKGNKIIARAGNRVKLDNNPTHHAEIVAMRKASRLLRNRHLEDCVLYATHEPCPMCASAAVWAKLKGIVSGARMKDMIDYRTKRGNDKWSWRTIDIPAAVVLKRGTPEPFLIKEFMRKECKNLFHS